MSGEARASAGRPGYQADKGELIRRLRRIEGQIEGIARMIETDRYCIDVVTQVSAAHAGLNQVAIRLLEDHTRHCVLNGEGELRQERTEELIAVVGRLLGSRR